MGKRVKILFFVGNLRPSNGITSFVMTYFHNIDHKKFQIDFALLNDVKTPYYNEILHSGGKIYILPPLKNIHKHVKRCLQILKENDYQIIHDNLLISSIPMMCCAYIYKVPIRILQSHNTELSSNKWKEKRNRIFLPLLKKLSNAYFACGYDAGISLFGNKKFKVIPNTIPLLDSYYSDEIRNIVRKKYKCDGKIIIGTVGRLSLQKNPFFAIKIIKSLVKINPNIQYWWIGSGELDGQVKKYIEDNHLSKYIKLFGSRDDVSTLYQAMDVFLLPSLFEGLPIVAIEAQAAGLPCVISDSVTKELVYTDLIDFVSLNSSVDIWSKQILRQSQRKLKRSGYREKLEKSNYYLPRSVELLEREYLNLLNK